MQDFSLPAPDAVIAGTGTVIYWRQEDGSLVVDEEFTRIMNEQRISYLDNESKIIDLFDPGLILKIVAPELLTYRNSHNLIDILIDSGPVLSDGSYGTEGLRLVIRDLEYVELKK